MKGLELTKIIAKIEQFSPLSLAGSWDNVGLLVEPYKTAIISKIILTNDLTESVVNECIDKNANMILSYHPPIFKPLKTLTKAAWKERIIISCIANNVAVYSPHTTLDAVNGGVNDWLVIPFGPGESKPLQEVDTGVGPGRLVVLNQPILLNDAIEKLKNHLKLDHLRLAVGVSIDRGSKLVKTIAVCAGSGSSVLRNVEADLWITGEMSHHEVLDAVHSNTSVILCEHSNTERGYLRDIFQDKLFKMLDGQVSVEVSEVDKDPLFVV